MRRTLEQQRAGVALGKRLLSATFRVYGRNPPSFRANYETLCAEIECTSKSSCNGAPADAGLICLRMHTGNQTHSTPIGYLLWIFGFTGAHRFYFGKPISGAIWFFTFGLCGIGWLIDVFLIPSMNRNASLRFVDGPIDYSVAWILLTFLGAFGVHRFYLGKWGTGILYLLTLGLLGLGVLYDFCTLNTQISERNFKT